MRLFFFVCLVATVLTSLCASAAIREPVNCQALIQEGLPVTEQTYLNIATQPYVLNRARGEFETKEAFGERTAKNKNALLSEVGGGFTFSFYDIPSFSARYDVDWSALKIELPTLENLNGRFVGFNTIFASNDKSLSNGDIKVRDEYRYGVAFPKTKRPVFPEHGISLHLAPELAKKLKGNIALAVVGHLVEPYIIRTSSFVSSPVAELPNLRGSDTFLTMDLACLALVSKQDRSIVLDLLIKNEPHGRRHLGAKP